MLGTDVIYVSEDEYSVYEMLGLPNVSYLVNLVMSDSGSTIQTSPIANALAIGGYEPDDQTIMIARLLINKIRVMGILFKATKVLTIRSEPNNAALHVLYEI